MNHGQLTFQFVKYAAPQRLNSRCDIFKVSLNKPKCTDPSVPTLVVRFTTIGQEL